MNRFIHEIASLAALMVLAASLWQGWGTLATVKRMLLAYLCFFALGAGLALVVKAAGAIGDGRRLREETGRAAETERQ